MQRRWGSVRAFFSLVLCGCLWVSQSAWCGSRPRVVVMTDIGGDPDDMQSLVRYLLYTCDVGTEGFCTGFGHGHYKRTRPDLIRERIEAYGRVVDNLRLHRPEYPEAEALLDLLKDGHNGEPHAVGPGMDSEASDWIIRVLERPDPRPVWFSIWGGPRELAQAIWRISKTRSPARQAELKAKIRVHSIADQDRTAGWVKTNHPDVFWIFSSCFRGVWKGYDQEIVSPGWLHTHVREGHGPLGALYPAKAAGKAGVKEGDTPSFFYVLPNGLSDPEYPEWGGWGGRFRRSGRGAEYVPDADTWSGRRHSEGTIARWRVAYQHAFEARMDWCVKPYADANHAPMAVLNGDRSSEVLEIAVKPGDAVMLRATGSADPDGDALRFRWWYYPEPGRYAGPVQLSGQEAESAAVTVPRNAGGCTLHIILEITDDGVPPLTAYRRAVLRVAGKAHAEDAKVTSLPPPPPETGPWTFYRGINLNGPPVEIDGNRWDGDRAEDFVCSARPLRSAHVPLIPACDAHRERMIHAFRWDRRARMTVRNVPSGQYAVYAYVWEETTPETITLTVNGKEQARDVYTGFAGEWQRLGPWYVTVSDGNLLIEGAGGAVNFSGIEMWRRTAAGEQ